MRVLRRGRGEMDWRVEVREEAKGATRGSAWGRNCCSRRGGKISGVERVRSDESGEMRLRDEDEGRTANDPQTNCRFINS